MALANYDEIISGASKLYKVDPDLLRAMIQVESRGRTGAVSSKGARGLMQLMPETARAMGVEDLGDPRQNIFGGAKYIAKQLKATKGDVSLSLARYNAGPGAVKKYGGVPPFKETQAYIPKVLEAYGRFKQTSEPKVSSEVSQERRLGSGSTGSWPSGEGLKEGVEAGLGGIPDVGLEVKDSLKEIYRVASQPLGGEAINPRQPFSEAPFEFLGSLVGYIAALPVKVVGDLIGKGEQVQRGAAQTLLGGPRGETGDWTSEQLRMGMAATEFTLEAMVGSKLLSRQKVAKGARRVLYQEFGAIENSALKPMSSGRKEFLRTVLEKRLSKNPRPDIIQRSDKVPGFFNEFVEQIAKPGEDIVLSPKSKAMRESMKKGRGAFLREQGLL